MRKAKKNPVYFNAACRLVAGENWFSCNCVVNEVSGRRCAVYSNADYKVPEVVAYKAAMGFKNNNGARFKDKWYQPPRKYPDFPGASRHVIRAFALLLAYESGVGSDLIS